MQALTAVVLCGGAGTRLGGIDKPLRPLAGLPLIAHVLRRLAPQVPAIIISANRSLERYAEFGHAVIDDGAYAGCGPLAGILAGLTAAVPGDVICVPGDAPLLPTDLAMRLDSARQKSNAAIAFASDGRGAQPLCCLLPRDLLADLRSYLDRGGHTPREWFARHRAETVDFSDSPQWGWSLNTEAEWAAAERHLASSALS